MNKLDTSCARYMPKNAKRGKGVFILPRAGHIRVFLQADLSQIRVRIARSQSTQDRICGIVIRTIDAARDHRAPETNVLHPPRGSGRWRSTVRAWNRIIQLGNNNIVYDSCFSLSLSYSGSRSVLLHRCFFAAGC